MHTAKQNDDVRMTSKAPILQCVVLVGIQHPEDVSGHAAWQGFDKGQGCQQGSGTSGTEKRVSSLSKKVPAQRRDSLRPSSLLAVPGGPIYRMCSCERAASSSNRTCDKNMRSAVTKSDMAVLLKAITRKQQDQHAIQRAGTLQAVAMTTGML